jgi:hypothetical protein
MRIDKAVLTLLCAAVLFIPASRDIETAGAGSSVHAAVPMPAALQVACDLAAAEPDSVEAILTGLTAAAQPNDLWVDTFTCGGCCGNEHQVRAFLRCCERGGGFACARRFGCK